MRDLTFGREVCSVIAAALFIAAQVRGAAPERILSGALVVVTVMALVFAHLSQGVQLAIDLLLFSVIWIVAIRANRAYPIWLGAGAIVNVTSHLWHFDFDAPLLRAHLIMDYATFGLQLIIMAVGISCHVKRVIRLGATYPAWRT